MAPFESLGTVSYSLPMVTMALSCIISEIKRSIGQKSRLFHTPLHSTPPLSGFCRNIIIMFGIKIKMFWLLPDGVKTVMICLAVSTEYRRVTDGQTDGRTDRHLPTA